MFETLRSSFHGIDLSNSLTPSQSPSRATVILTSLSYLVGDKWDQRMEKQTQLKKTLVENSCVSVSSRFSIFHLVLKCFV